MKDWTIRKFWDIRIHANNCVGLLFYHLVSPTRTRPVPHHFWKSPVSRPISLPPSQHLEKHKGNRGFALGPQTAQSLAKPIQGMVPHQEHCACHGTVLLWAPRVSTSASHKRVVWATDMLILRSEGISPDENDHKRMRSSKGPPRTATLSPVTLQLKAGTMPPVPLSH